ncbi:MAG TPA: hypothetical protein VIV15_05570 [Anaerolineales bacterium]
MITQLDLIRQREERATDAPWPETCVRLVWFKKYLRRSGAQRPDEDIAFIAHSREDIPALLAVVTAVMESWDDVPLAVYEALAPLLQQVAE